MYLCVYLFMRVRLAGAFIAVMLMHFYVAPAQVPS